MKIKMKLLSDTIPGNGSSIPGGEDISVLSDEEGFPYYKGGTLKGIFREELNNLLRWDGMSEKDAEKEADRLLGVRGSSDENDDEKLRFSNLVLSQNVRNIIRDEKMMPSDVLDAFSYLRTFTAIGETGTASEGSLRSARCLKEGLIFYGELDCREEDKERVKEVLSLIRWIGSMRNRGFGKVLITGED